MGDSKYLFLGFSKGNLAIYNLENDEFLRIHALPERILSISFIKDYQTALICDVMGNLRKIRWQANAEKPADYDFTFNTINLGIDHVSKICMTNDQKYFVVGTVSDTIALFSTRNSKKITQFCMGNYINEITVNNQDKYILSFNRYTTIDKIDLRTFQMSIY